MQRAQPSPGQFEDRGELLGVRTRVVRSAGQHAPSHERRQHRVEAVGHLGDTVDHTAVVVADQPACRLGEGTEASGGDLHAQRLGHHVLDGVGLVEDHDVVLGKHGAVAGDVGGVEVGVHDDDVGGRGALARLLGEADGPRGTAERPRALPGRHRQRRPGPGGGLEVELGAITGGRGLGPGDEPAQLAPQAAEVDGVGGGARCRPCPGDGVGVEQRHARQALVLGPAHLGGALAAEIVRPSLQHREGHGALGAQRRGHEGQVLGGELVLQGPGGGGHHHRSARHHRRDQVGEGFPRARARPHHQVASLLDGPPDRLGHRPLARPVLPAAGERGGHGGQDLRDFGGVRHRFDGSGTGV